MGRDKKALDGLTFVLDGPDGVEVVPASTRPPRPPSWRRCDHRTERAMSGIVLLLSGPNLNLLGRARARGLRHRHPRRPRRVGPRRGRRPRPHARARAVEPRGRAGRRHPRRPGPLRGDRHQRRARSPTTPGAPRRAGRVRRPDHRAAPLQPVPPRAVAQHLRGRTRGHRAPSAGSVATATSWPWPRWPGCWHDAPPLPADGRRGRGSVRLRAGLDGRRLRRAARHPPHQHPLPHRLHRLRGACWWSMATGCCFVTDGRYEEQAADELADAGVSDAGRDRSHQRGPAEPDREPARGSASRSASRPTT